MRKMKRGKAPGPLGVTMDLLRYAGETGVQDLKKVFELIGDRREGSDRVEELLNYPYL